MRLEKTKAFWLYIVGGAIAFVLGGMLLPVWESFENELFFRGWGRLSVNIMISALLTAYICLYLVKRIKRYSTTPAQLVAIVELVLMVVIAVVCTVSAFVDFIGFGDPCQIFGLAIWARGVSGVFTGYYCDSTQVKKPKKGRGKSLKVEDEPTGKVDDFTVWRLAFAVFLISMGTYLFILPPLSALTLQWMFSVLIILVGLFFMAYGVALKPEGVKKPKAEKPEESEGKKKSPNEPIIIKKDEELERSEGRVGLTEGESMGGIKITLTGESASAVTDTALLDAITDEEEKKEALPAGKK